MSIIKTENLTYIYGQNTPMEASALRDVNIEVRPGEFVGVIGPTGSGKSTLVQQLNGLLRPTSGKVFIDGEDIWAKPKEIRKFRFKVGLVFQYPEYQLFEETVRRDIAFGPKNMGLEESEIERRVKEAAELVGLPASDLDKSPFELSGGRKRRAAIAGVLAMRPQVLILDEPVAGLDPRGRDRILNLVRDYHRHEKNTVLIVSHSMEDIAKYAPKVLVMNRAELFMYDEVGKIFSRAEEMERIGLAVPQITQICMELARRGYPIRPDTYTVDAAKQQIMAILRERGDSRD